MMSEELQTLIDKLAELDVSAQNLEIERKEVKQRMADIVGAHNIGKRTTPTRTGKVYQVAAAEFSWMSRTGPSVNYFGHLVKKDGTLSDTLTRLYVYADDKFV